MWPFAVCGIITTFINNLKSLVNGYIQTLNLDYFNGDKTEKY